MMWTTSTELPNQEKVRCNRTRGYVRGKKNQRQQFRICIMCLNIAIKPCSKGNGIWKLVSIDPLWCPGKCSLPCPKGHHHERSINVLSGCSTFWRHPKRLWNFRDGVHWGMVNDTCRQYSLSVRFDWYQFWPPLSSRWTVPLINVL